MQTSLKYCVFAFLTGIVALAQSCIGDDLSDCGYDLPPDTRNVHLAFKYKPVLAGEAGPTDDGVNEYSLLIYDSTEVLKQKILNVPYTVENDSVDIRMQLEPGTYYMVFTADNGRKVINVADDDELEGVEIKLDTTIISKPLALYYALVDTFRVPNVGIAERKSMLTKLSNTIRVNVTGVDSTKYVPQKVAVDLLLPNAVYNWEGEIADTTKRVYYVPEYTPLPTGRSAVFSTLALSEDISSHFDIRAKNKQTGTQDILFTKDLIDILKQYIEMIDEVDELEQIHEFKVDIDFKNTNFDLYVNDWLVIKSDQTIN